MFPLKRNFLWVDPLVLVVYFFVQEIRKILELFQDPTAENSEVILKKNENLYPI